jgi:hypothetical protein
MFRETWNWRQTSSLNTSVARERNITIGIHQTHKKRALVMPVVRWHRTRGSGDHVPPGPLEQWTPVEEVAMSVDKDHIQEIVIVERDDVAEVMRFAAENGVEVQEFPTRGMEPVTTVTLLLLGGTAAVATVAYLIDRAKGGQVIDLRDKAPKAVYRSRDVVYGLVLIVATDGTVTVEVKEPRGMFGQVMETLKGISVELGKAGIATVTEVVKKTVGDAAQVTIQPTQP